MQVSAYRHALDAAGKGAVGERGDVHATVACCMEDRDGSGCEWPVSRHSPSMNVT